MRAFIKNYIAAEKARREEEGREAGFSLIELIVVIVILGILVAVAIPIFLNLQQTARDNAAASSAANAATQLAAGVAQNPTVDPTVAVANTFTDLSGLSEDFTPALVFAVAGSAGNVDSICVRITSGGGVSAAKLSTGATPISSGPGC